jgi:uncharacterized protein GlcG (DUF336 family)
MTRTVLAAAAALLLAGPAASQDEGGAFAEFKLLRPDVALDLAEAALISCREGGYQVAVAVVDRFGTPQVVIRDRFAGAHTIETATRKAWTAASFRDATLELDRRMVAGELSESLRGIPGALFLGGGVPVQSAGSIVAAIGISGAPGPEIDHDCAEAGIAAIADILDF